MLIGIAAAVIVLGAGGFFYMQSQKKAEEEKKAQAAAVAAAEAKKKEDAERRQKEELEKARLAAEQKAREEAEAARKKYEAEIQAKLAAAEAEAKAQAAARLANARGNVVVTTDPAGASVTIAGLPARVSPATFNDIKIGKYPVTVSLAQHDEVKFEIDVTENSTTEVPMVKLTRLFGSLEIASEPAGAGYEIRPANATNTAPEARRSGQTPATLNDLPPGEYIVTLTREGWTPHTQNVTVGRNATANVSWTFPNGVVRITSEPAGATVTRNGQRIGVTPLTLPDQQPGNVRYELSLANYEPATLSGRVESGKALNLNIPLLSVDRLVSLSELDKRPEPTTQVQPEVPGSLNLPKGGRVEIELVVTKTGATKDPKIASATNAELGNLCLTAASKWKWKPGMINGKPVNVKVVVPFVIAATAP
jgi:cell division protein FtsN